MFSHRIAQVSDFEHIALFPQSEEELFYMFPTAKFPLTAVQLYNASQQRHHPTVVIKNKKIVGYANFYELKEGEYCSIGNVIVHPHHRGEGIASYLVEVMEKTAQTEYCVQEIRLSCFNHNTSGLLLYHKLGYKPYAIEVRTDKYDNRIALIEMKKKILQK